VGKGKEKLVEEDKNGDQLRAVDTGLIIP